MVGFGRTDLDIIDNHAVMNFVRTMLRIGKERDTVRVVNDQIGTPTYSADFARLEMEMVRAEAYGTYHSVNTGGYIS